MIFNIHKRFSHCSWYKCLILLSLDDFKNKCCFLPKLAEEIRERIITVTKNGGHLASNLGAAELTIRYIMFLIHRKTQLF